MATQGELIPVMVTLGVVSAVAAAIPVTAWVSMSVASAVRFSGSQRWRVSPVRESILQTTARLRAFSREAMTAVLPRALATLFATAGGAAFSFARTQGLAIEPSFLVALAPLLLVPLVAVVSAGALATHQTLSLASQEDGH
jgi:hypothetical protein